MDKRGLKLGGKYKIGKKLGAGAFGEVYLGKSSRFADFYRFILANFDLKSCKQRFNLYTYSVKLF